MTTDTVKVALVTFAGGVALGLVGARGVAVGAAPDAGPRLVGAWVLNQDLSDPRQDPPATSGRDKPGGRGRGRSGFGGSGGGRRGSGGADGGPQRAPDESRMEAMQEVLRDYMEARTSLTIVVRDQDVLITGNDGRTLTLTADGKRVKGKAANGLVSLSRKTHWNGDALLVEVDIDDGPTVVQTYSISEGGAQLVVTTTIKSQRADRPLEIRRVYDRQESVAHDSQTSNV